MPRRRPLQRRPAVPATEPPAAEKMTQANSAVPTPDEIVAELGAALADATSAAQPPWELEAVQVRQFVEAAAVVEWKAPGRTLGFIIAPTQPEARTFARTRRFDVVYFSADFTDDEQEKAYQRDHAQILHFVRWMRQWDPT